MEKKLHRRQDYLAYMRQYVEENRDRLNAQSRARKAANPEKQRARKLKERYGLTLEEYDNLLESQGGGCAICGSETPRRKGSKFLVVDHCHDTGDVRGLLCYRCNVGLGNFEDSKEMLLKAIEYLGGMNAD